MLMSARCFRLRAKPLDAIENDVHVLALESGRRHSTLVPEVIAELKKLDREDIWCFRRRYSAAAYDELFKAGVTDIFGRVGDTLCAQKFSPRLPDTFMYNRSAKGLPRISQVSGIASVKL